MRPIICLTERSRSGEDMRPRKYFWATMLVAVCDQNLGNSTSFCSNAGPSLPGMWAWRSSHSTSSKGSRPGIVKRRPGATLASESATAFTISSGVVSTWGASACFAVAICSSRAVFDIRSSRSVERRASCERTWQRRRRAGRYGSLENFLQIPRIQTWSRPVNSTVTRAASPPAAQAGQRTERTGGEHASARRRRAG